MMNFLNISASPKLAARVIAYLILAFTFGQLAVGGANAADLTFNRIYQGSLSGQTFTTTTQLNADAGSIRFADGGTQRAFQNTSGTLYYTIGGVPYAEAGVLNSRYPNGNTLMNAVAFSGGGVDRLLVLGGSYTSSSSYSGSSNAIVDKLNEYIGETAPDPSQTTLLVNGGTTATVAVGQNATIVVTVKLASGSPVAGAAVSLSASPSGISSTSPTSATTDSSGQAAFTVQAGSTGTVTYNAVASANGTTTTSSGSVSITFAGVRSAANSSAVVPSGTAGLATTVTVTVRDSVNTPIAGAAQALTASVGGTNAGAATSGIIDQGSGAYAFTYTPAVAGTDSIVIKLDGTAISGSPYSSLVTAPALAFTPASGGGLPGGTVGTSYSQTITASGGTAPYGYTATGLPAGLAIDPSTGAITGTPTTAGSYTVTVSVTDANGATGVASYTVAVVDQAPIAGPVTATVAANSSANPITLNLSGGTATSVAIASPPAHGTVAVSGTSITYTPVAGYSGADSFTYTAAHANGTSAAATVSLTVTASAFAFTPASGGLPGGTVGTAYSQTITAGSGTAPYSYTATGLPAGLVIDAATGAITGTPTTAGSYTVTVSVTDANGATGVATYTVAVVDQAPVAGAVTATVAANSSANPITLNLSGGAATSVAIANPPAHGTAAVSGTSITYTPAAGYAGPDSFTYTAAHPHGSSAAATVNLTVTAPALAFTPASGGLPGGTVGSTYSQTIATAGGTAPFVYTATGLPTGLAIDRSTGAIAGTPTDAGSYTVTISVTDANGTTGAATYSLVVAAPPPPVAADSTSATVPANTSTQAGQSVSINLSSLVSGQVDEIRIVTQPRHGTVTFTRTLAMRLGQSPMLLMAMAAADFQIPGQVIAVYKPEAGYQGPDSFQFFAVGPGGASAPATVSIDVVGRAPSARDHSANTIDGQPVSVDLIAEASDGPLTGATIVDISPAERATAVIVPGTSAGARTFRLEVTPQAHFSGRITVRYTLTNAFGTSAPATVTVNVTSRPDPTSDPTVGAISDAQAEAARRFSRAQVSNFMQHAESLHGAKCARSTNSLRISSTDRDYREQQSDEGGEPTHGDEDRGGAAAGPAHDGATQCEASFGVWTGGTVDVGTRDAVTGRSKISATTAGISAGVDARIAKALTVGVGAGLGQDSSDIDGGDAHVSSDSKVVALYGSFAPVGGLFIDGVLARGWLDFDTRRVDPTSVLETVGRRRGRFTTGVLSIGIDRVSGPLQWSLYGRGEYMGGTLDAYRENGAGIYDLRFDKRDLDSLTGAAGFEVAYGTAVRFGVMSARLRGEWLHEFIGGSRQGLDYADVSGSSYYGIDAQHWLREQFLLLPGIGLSLRSGWDFGIDLGVRAADDALSATTRLQIRKEF